MRDTRYHSSAAALIASGFLLSESAVSRGSRPLLMRGAGSTDDAERRHLYDHLAAHVAFLRNCGTLSEVTVHTMTAIEASLAKVNEQKQQVSRRYRHDRSDVLTRRAGQGTITLDSHAADQHEPLLFVPHFATHPGAATGDHTSAGQRVGLQPSVCVELVDDDASTFVPHPSDVVGAPARV